MTKEEMKKEAEEKCVCTDEAMRIMYRIGYIDGAEPREKRIAELEKENAELKEQCSILADCNTCISACKTENIEMKNNLTKAKEIIKELVRVEYADFTNGDYSNELSKVLEQAEQFLSEVEK